MKSGSGDINNNESVVGDRVIEFTIECFAMDEPLVYNNQ